MDKIEEYTREEFRDAFELIFDELTIDERITCARRPRAFLLGGQSGAGKSTLHDVLRSRYKANIVVINGDEFRSRHPRYVEINEAYGIEMPAYTAAWASQMVEKLVDVLSQDGYNLIVEGTLCTSAAPMKTAALLKERGYGVLLAVMAVKPEISLVSCQLRYEMIRIAGTVPRAVVPAHHMTIVENIVESMAVLQASDLFDEIGLYARSRECLFSSNNSDVPAVEALKEILLGAWSSEELAHYAYLQNELSRAKQTQTSQKQ